MDASECLADGDGEGIQRKCVFLNLCIEADSRALRVLIIYLCLLNFVPPCYQRGGQNLFVRRRRETCIIASPGRCKPSPCERRGLF